MWLIGVIGESKKERNEILSAGAQAFCVMRGAPAPEAGAHPLKRAWRCLCRYLAHFRWKARPPSWALAREVAASVAPRPIAGDIDGRYSDRERLGRHALIIEEASCLNKRLARSPPHINISMKEIAVLAARIIGDFRLVPSSWWHIMKYANVKVINGEISVLRNLSASKKRADAALALCPSTSTCKSACGL